MKAASHWNRRSFLSRIVGATVLTSGAVAVASGRAAGQAGDHGPGSAASLPGGGLALRNTSINDQDGHDIAGRGRGNGHTDSDARDRACLGRGRRPTGLSDADSPPNANVGGNGRGTGLSDFDGQDRPCGGRRRTVSGWTDSDRGARRDTPGNGRGTGFTDNDMMTDVPHNGHGPRSRRP